MTVESLLRQAEVLTPEERRELAERLLREDDPAADPPLSDAMKAVLERRMAELDANPSLGIPWEVVYAESLKRTRQ